MAAREKTTTAYSSESTMKEVTRKPATGSKKKKPRPLHDDNCDLHASFAHQHKWYLYDDSDTSARETYPS